jgi:chemotaxis protein histidine kinase CheA
MDPTAYMDDFRAEAVEHLRTLDAQLLQLERNPSDPRPIRAMFLSAHTIKGGAAMLGLADVSELAHALEDVLAYLRDESEPLDAEMADLLFRGLDRLRDLVDRAAPGGELDPATAALAEALRERAQASLASTTGASAESVPAGATPRVLLVDDSPTVRTLETLLLSEAGFDVEAVGDGQQALSLAQTGAYHLLVTSIELRGLRGLDLAAAVRASPACSHLPIIVMSGDDSAVSRHLAAEIGVQAYLRKGSFGQQQLVQAAQELLAPRPPSEGR